MPPLEILDTTLRDGSQGACVSFTVRDKLRVASLLDELGVRYIEAGQPAASPRDRAFFEAARGLTLRTAQLSAFGSAGRRNTPPEEDADLRALLAAETPVVTLFGKTPPTHVRKVLRVTLEENLLLIRSSTAFCAGQSREVIYDAEHFFDGWQEDADYALETLRAAHAAGARVLCLCDTNGGAHPLDVQSITAIVVRAFPGVRVGIHCHNDRGCAVASSLLAYEAGACHIQGTLTGMGERCGNANLSTLLPDLLLFRGESGVRGELSLLTALAAQLHETANLALPDNLPYVGASAFAHKAGTHVDGLRKLPASFEHVDPALVGNTRRFPVSEMAGRAATLLKIRELMPALSPDGEEIRIVANAVKDLERNGCQFETAEASFVLFVRRLLGAHRPAFVLKGYEVSCTAGVLALAEEARPANAPVRARLTVEAFGESETAFAVGNGPVNALDKALRAALARFYPELFRMRLVDYKVRVLPGDDATASRVRVLVDSSDRTRDWTTMGVSTDIIEASWRALQDAAEYFLLYGQLE